MAGTESHEQPSLPSGSGHTVALGLSGTAAQVPSPQPVEAPLPTRPPLRLVPSPAAPAPTAGVGTGLAASTRLVSVLGLGALLFSMPFLLSGDSPPAWRRQTNPFTGKPYESASEYEDVQEKLKRQPSETAAELLKTLEKAEKDAKRVPQPSPIPICQKCKNDNEQRKKRLTYVTYTLRNPKTGEIYVGRSSGYGTPEQVIAARYAGHHMKKLGFVLPTKDKALVAALPGRQSMDPSYLAIRGREQQMIDSLGGRGVMSEDVV